MLPHGAGIIIEYVMFIVNNQLILVKLSFLNLELLALCKIVND